MTVTVSGHTCVLADNVKETTSTTGTGTYQLNGAAAGFVSFLTAIGNGNKTLYRAQTGSSWEIGVGTVASGSPPTLARTLILKSSAVNDAAVSWSTGAKDIFVVAPAALLDQIGAAAGLPGAGTVTNTMLANMPGWSIKVRNASSTGVPSDAALANITTDVVPAAGDFLLGFLASGEIRKWEMSTVTGSGIPGPGSVANSSLADMPAWSFKVRNAGSTGVPSDAALASITTDAVPVAGDFLIGFLASGEIRKWAVSSIQATAIASTKVTVFTASGTFTRDAKCLEAECHGVGAGGGGGGAQITGANESAEGAGGGGGAYCYTRLSSASLGASVSVTIGQGGAGGGGAASGASGGTTVFGSHLDCDGGTGGVFGSATTGNTTSEGGVGGTQADSVGMIEIPGSFGGTGRVIGGQWVGGNSGGAAAGPWGGGSSGGTGSGNGLNGRLYGGGGMGAHITQNTAAATGGTGADGIVVVIERLSP